MSKGENHGGDCVLWKIPPSGKTRQKMGHPAGARNNIGIMPVSGMFIGTAFTLFVVPSIYMLVAKMHTAFREEEAQEIKVHEAEEAVA